jgi:clan AA aspartic protease (TIGR02281 family)
MNKLKILLLVSFYFASQNIAPNVHATDNYYIGKDRGGVYFQTNEHGSWYINEDDIENFSVGEKGKFRFGKDDNGTYVVTDRRLKFYVKLGPSNNSSNQSETYRRDYSYIEPESETDVSIIGNQILVPVTIGYRSEELTVTLLFDTGASITVLHKEIAEQLGIKDFSEAILLTAGGQKIKANFSKLNYLEVGPYKKENIDIGFIEYNGPSVEHQGLLGMNFLRNTEYRINFKKSKIFWDK